MDVHGRNFPDGDSSKRSSRRVLHAATGWCCTWTSFPLISSKVRVLHVLLLHGNERLALCNDLLLLSLLKWTIYKGSETEEKRSKYIL